jgi:hypothetical protein
VIHIGIPGDEDEIAYIPSPVFHVVQADGQKIRTGEKLA